MDKMKAMNPALINGLNRIENLIPTKPAGSASTNETGSTAFKDLLSGNSVENLAVKPVTTKVGETPTSLKFSNHAIERMQSRGISYTPQDLTRLGEAIQKAAAKGSKDTLVLMDKSALIVSVKNNTVVTVMDKNALKENVFTNIDSTIVI